MAGLPPVIAWIAAWTVVIGEAVTPTEFWVAAEGVEVGWWWFCTGAGLDGGGGVCWTGVTVEFFSKVFVSMMITFELSFDLVCKKRFEFPIT